MTDHISLQSGTELVGDYRITRVLGAGGFGITYLANEMALDRQVTIKEYFPSDFAARSDGTEAVPKSQNCSSDYLWGLERFIEEAQILARFDHPNIVRVYRYFRANNTGYMVLHFEEGQSLKLWLKNLNRAPRQKELDAFVPDLLDALELIHRADFLHRDIAPDNIIVRKNGQPVLIDFGSARGEIASHSKTVSALVKPGYSPYEQYAETSRQQGPWTDIYALAATLYHAVTGKRPPDAPSRMVSDELVPAREAAIGGYRKGFLTAIDNALKLKVEARPKSIAVWRRQLMAPDAPRKSWRATLQAKSPAAVKPQPKAAAKNITPAAKKGAARNPAAAPPKAAGAKHRTLPSRAGGLIEFLDGLKSKPLGKAKQEPVPDFAASPAKAVAADKQAPVAEKSGRLATLWKRLKTSPNPIKVRPRQNNAANEPQPRPVPAPIPQRPRRRARPRRQTLRPVLMKLFIGVGMASAAVALQNRFPWPSNAATAPLTTASINKQAKTAAPKAQSQRPERTFAGHTSAVNAAAYANNERTLVTAGADGSLKTWDAESGAPLRTMVLTDGPALSIAARGNRVLTSHRNGAVALWNLETGDKIATFKRNDAEVWSVAFIGNGERFAAASHDWKVAVWEIAAPAEPVQILSGHKNSAQVVAFGSTSRGSVIATGSADKTVKFWSSKSHKLLRTYRGHRDFVNHIAFSSDGRSLASASLDGNIRIWSTRSRRLYRSYKAHDGPVTGLAFSNDGRTLVSAGEDGQLRLWDIKRRSSKRTLTAEAGKLQSLALSKQAERLAAATASGQIQIWQLSTGAKVSAK